MSDDFIYPPPNCCSDGQYWIKWSTEEGYYSLPMGKGGDPVRIDYCPWCSINLYIVKYDYDVTREDYNGTLPNHPKP